MAVQFPLISLRGIKFLPSQAISRAYPCSCTRGISSSLSLSLSQKNRILNEGVRNLQYASFSTVSRSRRLRGAISKGYFSKQYSAKSNSDSISSGVGSRGNFPNKYKDTVYFGYKPNVFAGKEEQKKKVIDCLRNERKSIPDGSIEDEVYRFYDHIGLDDYYFQMEPMEAIAEHIEIIYAAKVAARASHAREELNIHVKNENDDSAIYLDSAPVTQMELDKSHEIEQAISKRYLDNPKDDAPSFRLESFTSTANIDRASTENSNIHTFLVTKCNFIDPSNSISSSQEIPKIAWVSDQTFLEKASEQTIQMYQNVMDTVLTRFGPAVGVFEHQQRSEIRLVIGYRRGSIMRYFPSISNLLRYYGLSSFRTYIEQFSNGVTIISYNFKSESFKNAASSSSVEELFDQITKEASLLYCLPYTDIDSMFTSSKLSIQEVAYAHSVRVFSEHVMNKLGSEYTSLSAILDHSNHLHVEILDTIKRRLSVLAFTRTKIHDIIVKYPQLVRMMFDQFYLQHSIGTGSSRRLHRAKPDLSSQSLDPQFITEISTEKLMETIQKTCANDEDVSVMEMFVKFNNHLLKTNFFLTTKVALSFRFDPSFLDQAQFGDPLYAMIMSVGNEFRGFHLRFRDVARGGIRLIKSANSEALNLNARGLFDENYNLANTQMLKNKDIPEGGAKGVILLNLKYQDKPALAFQKYIDSIVDLLIPNEQEQIVDKYGKPEILFMGPDENTADLVDWATFHARNRKAPWWKSFFTGKSPSMGGIPHDKYGMTSLSVRRYVEGIYRKLNLDPTKLSKIQTGGPDGDLGSNEIKLSNENYIAVIDGSGVIYDPAGLNKSELLRLANERKMIDHFDTAKLSAEGYRVLVKDNNVRLPNGEVVNNGTTFRNTAHLRYKADVFVPCGGRPGAININNVDQLINEAGKPKIKYLVEGANLFVTQDAKTVLEKAGVVVIRDASANKGGVTSSSLEVLASLSFDDASFIENMCVRDGKEPAFYTDYVNEVKEIIQENANMEFECLWETHKKQKITYTSLSSKLSELIVKLDNEIYKYEKLWSNKQFRNLILAKAIPKTLQKKIGLSQIIERVPEAYLRAIFSKYLASHFVYRYTTSGDPFAFFDFISTELAKVHA
ncbi:NAD-dependent glutamate dehydrogenase Gdh2 [Schizosaccharomyces cryophilus OY26]|uniref:NAD-specific glutamate dehydrogenase n=1 Tax=Schizosaccharomyces cryophilus (strain OY26 / ATCC MYA-4695 / CBS 11777 / NBRC 106824 / NRRL Y48691) TaxID=653667 RepID=S9VWK5_SCHCR|nr:NAD-dependent glutamate dehydrogenase Gdh2 [Schizosaccharomyces cryophilus OY26]EPY50639.1 NAD-dependent glutamate dehydrogenase Gdh2 [Schizosaccharomyces cryophilus OY26]